MREIEVFQGIVGMMKTIDFMPGGRQTSPTDQLRAQGSALTRNVVSVVIVAAVVFCCCCGCVFHLNYVWLQLAYVISTMVLHTWSHLVVFAGHAIWFVRMLV